MPSQNLLTESFTAQNIHEHADSLNNLMPIDLADLISSKSIEEGMLIFNELSSRGQVQTFEQLSFKVQKEIINALPPLKVADLLNAVSPDDRTSLLENLPTDQASQLLKYLSPEERALTIKLLGYPENSVGRLMTPDYIAIHLDWTVRQVLDYIREIGHDSETVNVIYAIDDQGKLIDDFRIRQLLFASLETRIEELADHQFVALNVEDNEEAAVNVFRKYNRVALPVIDSKGLLLGIVTFDDILAVAVAEDTKDIQNIGGSVALKEPYMATPLLELVRKRIGWLLILFFGEMLTASAMTFYQDEIAKAVVLALFLPLIISSGGNAGSQASTLIIRAMALGEITLRDWWKIMHREIISGSCLGLALGTVGFFRVSLWSLLFNMYGPHWLLVALTIFFALIGVVLWGTLMGAMLPFVLRAFGYDPAVSSTPFVATLVDVTGLIIYFSIAMVVLNGSLL